MLRWRDLCRHLHLHLLLLLLLWCLLVGHRIRGNTEHRLKRCRACIILWLVVLWIALEVPWILIHLRCGHVSSRL